METQVPQEPIKLGFDPKESGHDEVFYAVFRDNLALSLWLLIKAVHRIADTKFEEWCLNTARAIREQSPSGPEELYRIIRSRPTHQPQGANYLSANWEESREWLERLLGVFKGTMEPVQYELDIE